MNTYTHKGFSDSSMLIKDVNGKDGIITGYFSKFGNVDAHNDVIVKGAYTKSIQENGPKAKGRIAHLWSHNASEPIGKLQELMEDDYGLYFVSKLVDSNKGRDVMAFYEANIINEHSVGIRVVKEAYEHDDEDKQRWDRVRTIKEAMIFEGSSVVLGANPDTPTLSVKDASSIPSLLNRMERVQKTLRNGSKITDEGFIQLEIELSQIQKDLSTLQGEEPQKHSNPNEPSEWNLKEIWDSI